MNPETIKLLVESALLDGVLSDDEKIFIYSKAKEFNIPKNEVDRCIDEITSKYESNSGFTTPDTQTLDQTASGFVTNDENTENTENTENLSGFVIQNDVSDYNASGFITKDTNSEENNCNDSPYFSNVKLLSDKGAMSLIYKGRRHNKIVAIKRLKPQNRKDKRYINLFNKEFENANQFIHPNIVQVYDKGIDENGPYYYMEYVDGKTLSNFITKDPISDNKINFARRVIQQLCDALSYVHLKQIYHRDLKPDNILITYKGNNVKLFDFGLSSADYFDDSLQKAGTPKYAAPEQKIDANKATHKSDIFSVGLIFLELLTGAIDKEGISKVENRQIEAIIQKCLQAKPEDRFDDCKQIYQSLISTERSQIIPEWLIEKIKEFAKNGKISKAEMQILKVQAEKNNISPKVLDAYVGLELEKAKQKIEEQKRLLKETEQKKQDSKKRQLEKEKEEYIRRQAAKEKLEQLKQKMGLETSEKKHPVKKHRTKRKKNGLKIKLALITIFIIVIIVFLKPPILVSFYEDNLSYHLRYKIEELFSRQKTNEHFKYIVAKNGLHLRTSKSTETKSNIIRTYPLGTAVTVINCEDEWCKVEIAGNIGYMSSAYLSKNKPSEYD